jgi:parvulin-like peptidyl-prolyl isomerase
MTQRTSPRPKDGAPRRSRRARIAIVLGSVAVLAALLAVRHHWPAERASAQMPESVAAPDPVRPTQPADQLARRAQPTRSAPTTVPDVVARVNNEAITRQQLATECLRHYGADVLDSYLDKRLIMMECASRGIQVNRADVDAEIERMAKHFNLSVQQWYKMLAEERGISPSQYANDIVWPTLALRRLAADQLQVSDAELREAYETQFGPGVKARLIASKKQEKIEKLRADAVANPARFGDIAEQQSEDTPSASDKGWIPPIRMHGGPKELETTAFAMKDGEISPILKVNDLYVIIKREGSVAAHNVPFELVAPQLKHMIEERKLRPVAHQVFEQLRKKARVENYFADPTKRNTGIAAVINGQQVTTAQLAEECLERHGKQALEATIRRKLIEQACKKANVTITEADIQQEIARAAEASVPLKSDGSPDVDAWIKLVTQEQGVSYDIYVYDSVWPSVALRKLIGDRVSVGEEEIERGFDANYGPRVRCLAIVFGDLRLAQRVWEMARDRHQALKDARDKQVASGVPAEKAMSVFFDSFGEFFGDLAEQYSVEPGSKKLRGQVPPINKWGRQPVLEKEAFALAPGQLSGIIQVADKYVVLFCEGQTTPVAVDKQSVRGMIIDDIREKKLAQDMDRCFQHLQDFATIDNFLAGTTQSPQSLPKEPRAAGNVMQLQQEPARR